MKLIKGDIVDFEGLLGVIIDTDESGDLSKGHVTVWFGEQRSTKTSDGEEGNQAPVVYNMPARYCKRAKKPRLIMH